MTSRLSWCPLLTGWILTHWQEIDEELRELVKGSPLYRYDPCRRSLRRFAGGRVERLAQVVVERRNLYPIDDRAADVAEDVAYSRGRET